MAELPWVALGLLGMTYLFFGVMVARRYFKPSCRNCIFWQHCVETRLGVDGPPPKRCF